MILWKSISGDAAITGPSAYIQHCEYTISPVNSQYQCRQYWTGKHVRILLKATRADSLEAAKAQCNGWDSTHER